MIANLNFYNENVVVSLPKSFYEFKLVVAEKYIMSIDDVNELIFLCENNIISNEEEYQKILKLNKGITILIQVSEKSKIYQKEQKNINDKIIENKPILLNNFELNKQFIENVQEKFYNLFKVFDQEINKEDKNEEIKKEDKNEEKKKEDKNEEIKKEDKNEEIKKEEIKKEDNIEKEQKEEIVIHKNVKCDICKKYPITGIRYKCTVCHNYDFCEECEKKYGEEHNHPLLKIRKPELAHYAYEYMWKRFNMK